MEIRHEREDSEKMVTDLERMYNVRQMCRLWYWNAINYLPPGMILTSFFLFPPVLQDYETQHSNKIDVGIGIAFGFSACGFLPLLLLAFPALRAQMPPRGTKLCLTTSLFGILNLLIHLAYGLKMNNIFVTALILAVAQIICFTAVIWLRSNRDLGAKSPHASNSRKDPIGTNLRNLVIPNISPPKHSEPGNLDGHPETFVFGEQKAWV